MAKYTKQKDGRYRTAVFTGQYNENGRPINKWLSAKSIKELDIKVAEAKHLANINALVFDANTTFGEFSQQWLKVAKSTKSIATNAMYDNVLKKTAGINDTPLCQISKMALQKIINDNLEHPRICQQLKLTLNQIFKYALEEKLITFNPAAKLDLPRRIKKDRRALTEEETQKIRDALLPLAERAFISTLYGTGMRPAEMYALTKQDIDYKNGCVNVSKSLVFDGNKPILSPPKSNHGIRSIIVSKGLLKILKQYSMSIDHDNLFADEDGNYRTKSGYYNYYCQIMKSIFNVSGDYSKSPNHIQEYVFRHNFCTLMYYQGISLKEAQRQMGHASYSLVLDVYSHLDAKKENTATKMDSICL